MTPNPPHQRRKKGWVEMKEMRKYSVNEIDRMRKAVGKILYNKWYPPNREGGGHLYHEGPFFDGEYEARERSRQAQIEDELRTYMVAGIDPEELEIKARIRLK